MQRRRLVERRSNGTGRAVTIALTEQGLGRVEHAAEVHAASVRRNFLGQFDRQLLEQVLSRAHELHEQAARRQ
jgi:DNA-binding MarR family transcriptional regulator